ncbi:hypothetical protein ACF0H5_013588 [Mactra antiquata]
MSDISQIPATKCDTGDTVIVAMDGSEYSDYALQFYYDTVHRPGNNVIIAHASEMKNISFPAIATMTPDSNALVTQELQAEEKRCIELVDKLTQKLNHLKLEGKIERIHGEPGHAVIELANEKHADFIVVGCRGKGSVRRTLTGSVTDYIVHHSHIPVMVARHKDHIKHHHGFHFPNPFHHHKKHDDKTEKSS